MTEPALLSPAPGLRAAPPEQAPPDPRYVLRYGSIRDGRIYNRLPASAASGSAGILGAGSFSATVPAGDRTPDIYRALPPGKGMWVLGWDDGQTRRVCDGGTIWNRSVSAAALSLGGAGFFAMLGRRVLVPDVAVSSVAKNSLTFTGDHGSIMRAIVAHVTGLTDGDLPVVLQAARAGTRTRTYDGFDLAWAGQRISELADVEPNTEFLFLPRFADGSTTSVVWDMVTGTEAVPQLSNVVPWRLNSTTPGQQVVGDVTVDDSATDTGTTSWAGGGGQEKSRVIRSATDTTLTDGGWPLLDRVTSNDSEDAAVVQRYANGDLASNRRPLRGVKVQVRASWWWGRQARIGDLVRVTADHRVIGRLDFTSRILEVGWDITSPWVSLTLADTLAEEGF